MNSMVEDKTSQGVVTMTTRWNLRDKESLGHRMIRHGAAILQEGNRTVSMAWNDSN